MFAELRAGCAEVARRAHSVRLDAAALERFASVLARAPVPAPAPDPAQRPFAREEDTLALLFTLSAVNFGSGWFPYLKKRAGRSGYFTLALALREHFEAHGVWRARELEALRAEDCARAFGQPLESAEVAELMTHYAGALNDLGALLRRQYNGRFANLCAAAEGRAARLVGVLAQMPRYRDVSLYQGLALPFYKRAQLTAADLARVFRGRGPGRFCDLGELTLFADNLVPHVLRMLGVLVYDLRLQNDIEHGRLLAPGSEPEVEIRAVALHAVERLVESCARRGRRTSAQQLDALLWSRGQRAKMKASPRHRTRCTFY